MRRVGDGGSLFKDFDGVYNLSTFVALVILGWGLCAGGLPGAGDGLDFRVGGLTWRVA